MLIFIGVFYSIVIFAVSVFLTVPFSSWLAHRIGAIDLPGEHKIHSQPTPRLGGLGILLAFVLALGSLLVVRNIPVLSSVLADLVTRQMMIFCASLLAIAIVGFLDDVYNQKAWLKFVLEGIIASFFILSLPVVQNIGVVAVIAWFWIVSLINGYNFLDGLDGLAASVAVMNLLALAAMFFISGDQFQAIVAGTLVLVTLGFLRYNWPPAIIFIGDIGSLSLGFIISALSLLLVSSENFSFNAILGVILAASLPVGDLSLTFLRRLVNGKPLFTADRGHYYDQMTNAGGISKLNAMRLSILIALAVCGLSVMTFVLPMPLAICPFVLGEIVLLLAFKHFRISLNWEISAITDDQFG